MQVFTFFPHFGFAEVTLSRKNSNKFGFSLDFPHNFGFAEVTLSRKNSNKFGFSLDFP